MKQYSLIIFLLLVCFLVNGQNTSEPDILWGNSSYFNLNVGESIVYNSVEVKLLDLENHYNKFKVGTDTIWLKVSKRSLPVEINGMRLFVADNINVKNLTDDQKVHGLLTKDVLLCISGFNQPMLDPRKYIFPISYNDGFWWSADEDSYMFSYYGESKNKANYYRSYEGIGIDLNDARGIEKHWIVAMEKSTVMWVENKRLDKMDKQACVLLQSNSNPLIFYVYKNLYNKTIEVKKGQKLMRGQLVGTAWGNEKWGHVQLLVIKSDTVPDYKDCLNNSLNFFPQLYELYHKQLYSIAKSFSRGKLELGRSSAFNGNKKNTAAFEEYTCKGWLLGRWNKADKVEHVFKGKEGNVRLRSVLFLGEKAESKNPKNYYEYEVNVKNGVYRVRVKVGDVYLPSWQKIDFEGINAATYSLEAGEQKWTTERVVKITDRKLTIRIYVDKENRKVAGLSEVVFQRAY